MGNAVVGKTATAPPQATANSAPPGRNAIARVPPYHGAGAPFGGGKTTLAPKERPPATAQVWSAAASVPATRRRPSGVNANEWIAAGCRNVPLPRPVALSQRDTVPV